MQTFLPMYTLLTIILFWQTDYLALTWVSHECQEQIRLPDSCSENPAYCSMGSHSPGLGPHNSSVSGAPCGPREHLPQLLCGDCLLWSALSLPPFRSHISGCLSCCLSLIAPEDGTRQCNRSRCICQVDAASGSMFEVVFKFWSKWLKQIYLVGLTKR